MRYLIPILFSSCAAIQPSPSSNCGVVFLGSIDGSKPFVTAEDTNDMVNAAIDATSFMTDFRFLDKIELCESLIGYRFYVNKDRAWTLADGRRVAGATYCESKTIVIGTPDSLKWRDSSAVHEFIHAFQKCKTPEPHENGDEHHGNWIRDNIWNAIEGQR